MKTPLFSFVTALLLVPALAEWEPRGMYHVWTGDGKPEPPADMLPGEIYDYNRSADGKYFTYAGIYFPDELAKGEKIDVAAAHRIRKNRAEIQRRIQAAGADNPTGSPDVHGQFIQTLKELMNGRKGILKNYYKYPHAVATPHMYLPPLVYSVFLTEEEDRTTDTQSTEPESDFLSDAPRVRPKTEKIKTYEGHNAWFAIFKGSVVAPRSMNFRFYGAADDAIVVRFNNKVVLETGRFRPAIYQGNGIRDNAYLHSGDLLDYHKEVAAGKHPDKRDYVVQKLKSTPYCNSRFNGITGGSPVKVTEGRVYPIEIIVGNDGGKALFYLLTQEVTPDNRAPLHLFRTNDHEPSLPEKYKHWSSSEDGPGFEADSLIWKIAPNEAKTKGKKTKRKAAKKFRNL